MIESRFATTLDGWSVVGGGVESFDSGSGNPPGSVRAEEGGSGLYGYEAPATWLGDRSAYLSGTLSFDLKQDGAGTLDDEDVILQGDGLSLYVDAGANPGTDWTSYTVTLDLGGGWKVGSLGGRVATREEIAQVLSDLSRLYIRGEFVDGSTNDASNLDNVVLREGTSPPPPGARQIVTSTFDSDVDGWSFIADVREFRHVPTGGNPGGFVIWNDESCFYFAGDTALTMDMKLIPMTCPRLDFAILPIGDNFTMDYDDAVVASDFIECEKIIGCHYDTFGFIKVDHEAAKKAFEKRGKELILPTIGESFDV